VLNYYTFIALDIAAQRTREAQQDRLVASTREGRDGSVRRVMAIGLAGFGRLVAATVRRLDACVADDFAESVSNGLATGR
jgi:hypothetical protein